MTVPTSDNREEYLGNGSTTVFAYSFKIFRNEELEVYLVEGDVQTLQTLGTHYSVSGAGNENGGNVTMTTAPTSSQKLVILRIVAVVQESDFRNQGAYYPETVEDEMDRSRMIDQQQEDKIARSLQRPAALDYWDAENRNVRNVKDAVELDDAVNKGQMDTRFNDDVITKTGSHWDGKGLQLRNVTVRSPVQDYDLPNMAAVKAYFTALESGELGDTSKVTAEGTTDQRALMAWMKSLRQRTIYVATVAEMQSLPANEMADGQRIEVTDNSASYYWDAATSAFIEIPGSAGLVNKHAWAGAVQNERDYATLGADITPDIGTWSRTNFDATGNHAAGTIGTLTTTCTGEAFAHYLLKVTIDTTATGRIKILQGTADIFGDQPNGYLFSTAAVLGDAIENNRTVTANEFYFLIMTSGTGFSDFTFETDTSWAGSITFAAIYPVSATLFSVAGYSELANGKENPVGLKTTGYNRGDVALGDKYTLGVFQYDGLSPTPAFNTAVGSRALGSNFKGDQNTALGAFALQYNEGSNNVGVGYSALKLNSKGQENTAIGYKCGNVVTTGYRNVFAGFWAGSGITTGVGNVELGWKTNTEPGNRDYTTVVGYYSGLLQAAGSASNVMVGSAVNRDGTPRALTGIVSLGSESYTYDPNGVSVGFRAKTGVSSGGADGSIAIGANSSAQAPTVPSCALGDAATANGDRAVGIGQSSIANGEQSAALGGLAEANGQYTTALGAQAGRNNTGTGNTYVGRLAGNAATNTFSNTTCLGQASAVTASDQVQLGNSTTTTYAYGPVQDRSDARDKIDIKALTDAQIAFFMDVEWRQFRMDYREDYDWGEKDGSKARTRYHIGAIAQQVEEAMKRHGVDFAGLQHHSINGGMDVYSIGYQEFIGLQGEIIQRQQRRLEDIEARLAKAGI